MSFIVIEGDNATGKTTLCSCFPFEIINSQKWFQDEEIKLKKLPLNEKIPAFLKFNLKCGQYGYSMDHYCVLARYWISTVCAAYADGLYDFQTAQNEARANINSFPMPEVTIFLRCPNSVRLSRIMERRKEIGDYSDPIAEIRNEKYLQISLYISTLFKNVMTFSTDIYKPNEIAKCVTEFLQQKGERNNVD